VVGDELWIFKADGLTLGELSVKLVEVITSDSGFRYNEPMEHLEEKHTLPAKYRVVKITCSSCEVVLRTTKHIVVYPRLSSSPSARSGGAVSSSGCVIPQPFAIGGNLSYPHLWGIISNLLYPRYKTPTHLPHILDEYQS
jgi:hypothetical protein